jgi:hypothetical protein
MANAFREGIPIVAMVPAAAVTFRKSLRLTFIPHLLVKIGKSRSVTKVIDLYSTWKSENEE